MIQALWTSDNIAQRAVILVGNKADLARSRVISLEGKLKPYVNKTNYVFGAIFQKIFFSLKIGQSIKA